MNWKWIGSRNHGDENTANAAGPAEVVETELRREEGVVIVTPDAQAFERQQCDGILRQLEAVTQPKNAVVVNLERVLTMDAHALGALMTWLKSARQREVHTALAGMQPRVKMVAQVIGLNAQAEIFGTGAEAVEMLKRTQLGLHWSAEAEPELSASGNDSGASSNNLLKQGAAI